MICLDNQTTCNIRKIHHLDYSNMQYCFTNYENTSFTLHRYCDLLYIISAGAIVITHFVCFKFAKVVSIVIDLMTLVEVVFG